MMRKVFCAWLLMFLGSGMISLHAQLSDRTFSIETDLAGPFAPYRRVGFDLEIWATEWFSIGGGREVDNDLSDGNTFIQSGVTNTTFSLRFLVSNLFLKVSSLEHLRSIRKRDSTNPTGTESEPTRQALLTGSRISLGYWLDLDFLFFTAGYFSETLNTEKITFNDDSTKEVGGSLAGPLLTIGIAF